MLLLKHQKGHHISLVDKKTGASLALSPQGAQKKGIDLVGGTPKIGSDAMELTEQGITLPVTLPPSVFTQFSALKAADRIPIKMGLDEWLVECVQKRLELDYKLELMLIPIGE